MVAISLYRGNLHRVPDVPRQWPMPSPSISLRQFKLLTHKRSEALSRLPTDSNTTQPPPHDDDDEEENKGKEEGMGDNGCPKPQPAPSKPDTDISISPPKDREDKEESDWFQESKGIEASVSPPPPPAGGGSATSENVHDAEIGGGGAADAKLEVSNSLVDQDQGKRESEKKLQILNDKKHHLVQMLKQILNAEEEMKRRSIQPSGIRAASPLQVESTLNIGSVSRHVPKISVEVNFGSDLGGESDDAANHNNHSRHLHNIHSPSPSAASPLSRPIHSSLQHNQVLHTPRTSSVGVGHGQTTSNALLGSATASPSRFAPFGHQGHATNLTPLTVPGTHFIASSPSPAASGGASSVFRDWHMTSPSWN